MWEMRSLYLEPERLRLCPGYERCSVCVDGLHEYSAGRRGLSTQP